MVAWVGLCSLCWPICGWAGRLHRLSSVSVLAGWQKQQQGTFWELGLNWAWASRLLYWEDGCSTGLSPKVERERCPHSQGIGLQKQLSSLGQLGQGEWGLFPEGHMFNIWGRWSLQYSSVAGRREV